MARRRSRKWIQHAVKKEGALSEWVRRNAPSLLNKDGTISVTKARAYYARHKDEMSTTTKRRFNLFFTLHKLRRRKK